MGASAGAAFRIEASVADAAPAAATAAALAARANGAPRAVVIGGGTGAPASIRALLALGAQTDAVVAMADDGGSTGILRSKAGSTPPGDVRKCLTAFAADAEAPFAKAFKYRFEFADDHSLGNLLLAALEDACGSFPQAVQECEKLLHARGHVLPSTLNRVTLCAETATGRTIVGQAHASHSRSALAHAWLEADEPIRAYGPAAAAIAAADLIVLGPGSLFTSIIPNVLVDEILAAVCASTAPVAFVCSLADIQGETRGMGVLQLVEVLHAHGLQGRITHVLADDGTSADIIRASGNKPIACAAHEAQLLAKQGICVIRDGFAYAPFATWHDPAALARAFAQVLA